MGVPSFAQIYREYFDFVWRCTRSYGVDADAIDDVVQEIFIVVQKRLHTLQEGDALRSWIYGIVRRTVSTHRRARRTRAARDVAEIPSLSTTRPSPLEVAEQSDQLKVLSSLLEQLDETKREVFILAEIAEMSAPEIAEAVGIPVNTAYSRLRAARHAFEEALVRYKNLLERKNVR
jgi:RNA polymerase sigma-70 factor (ECF subfamily)